jgi:hypothetical protein
MRTNDDARDPPAAESSALLKQVMIITLLRRSLRLFNSRVGHYSARARQQADHLFLLSCA